MAEMLRRWRRAGIVGSLVFGFLGWTVLAWWVLKADPWHRLVLASQVGRLSGREGAIVLIGDSIVKPVGSPCASVVNLAVPGARARDVPNRLIDEVRHLSPRAILVLIGINDLRWGDGAEGTARSIVTLAHRLQTAAPLARVVVLAPLPVTRNELAGAADARAVRATATHLREMLRQGKPRFADFSTLFGLPELTPSLTDDGLHLNKSGTDRLWNLLEAVATAAGAAGCR